MRPLILFATLAGFLGLSSGCGDRQAASVTSPFRDKLNAAIAIQNPFEKDNALVAVAKDAAAGGDTGVAHDALDKIANTFTKDNTAAECALKLAKAGKGAEATKVAQKISNSFTRDATLAKLAKGDFGN